MSSQGNSRIENSTDMTVASDDEKDFSLKEENDEELNGDLSDAEDNFHDANDENEINSENDEA